MAKQTTGLFGGNPVPTAPTRDEGPRQGPFEEKQKANGKGISIAARIAIATAVVIAILYFAR